MVILSAQLGVVEDVGSQTTPKFVLEAAEARRAIDRISNRTTDISNGNADGNIDEINAQLLALVPYAKCMAHANISGFHVG